MDLTKKKCVPCKGGVSTISEKWAKKLLKKIPKWKIKNGHLWKTFKFKEFLPAMKFVNSVAKLAEKEGHHPDFHIHYNIVELEIWTHAINGLSENDFILAAKIELR